MCTSFGLCSDETCIGMNFDISGWPIALRLKGEASYLFCYLPLVMR